MKIAKFVSLTLAILSGVFVLSCEKKAVEEKPAAGANISFSIALNVVSAEKAEVIVRHSGKETDTWYAFFTQDLQADEAALIEAEAAKVSADNLHLGRVQTVALTGLQEKTSYKFIAFCVTPEQEVYGKPASLTFSTIPDLNVVFTVSASQITSDGATVTIGHDLSPELTYTGFLTEDLTTDVKTLAGEHFASITTAGALNQDVTLFSGATQTVTLENLGSGIRYRYVAYGVFVDDKKSAIYYGTPAAVEFKTINFYHETSDWTVSVVENDTTHEGYPFKVTNTVAGGSSAGKYFFTYFTQEQVDDYDGYVDDVVAANVEAEVAALRAEAEERGVALSELLTSGTGSTFYSLDFDKYYMTVIGVTEDGTPTGLFAYAVLDYQPTETQKQNYEKWLGVWTVDGDVLEIMPAKQWVSYEISGIAPKLGYLVEGTFDAESGNLVLWTQEVDNYYEKSYGTISVQLYGCILYGGKYVAINGEYPIAAFSLTSDTTASMTPNTLELTDGSTYTLAGMNIYAYLVDQEAIYSFTAATDPILLPNTLTRVSEEGSEAYNAWLGSWTITRPEYTEEDSNGNNEPTGGVITDTWNISQDVADHSYLISGLDGFRDPVKASFDAETGNITLCEQQIGTVSSGSSTYIVYLMGLFENNTQIWGGAEEIFEGSINADGTATLTGLDFSGETQEGTLTSTFSGMEIFYLNSAGTQLVSFGADHWNEFYTFPCTITPKSGSGVKAVKTSNAVPVVNHSVSRNVQGCWYVPAFLLRSDSMDARSQYRHIR